MKTIHDLVVQKLHELIDLCWRARINHAKALVVLRAVAGSKETPQRLTELAREVLDEIEGIQP